MLIKQKKTVIFFVVIFFLLLTKSYSLEKNYIEVKVNNKIIDFSENFEKLHTHENPYRIDTLFGAIAP